MTATTEGTSTSKTTAAAGEALAPEVVERSSGRPGRGWVIVAAAGTVALVAAGLAIVPPTTGRAAESDPSTAKVDQSVGAGVLAIAWEATSAEDRATICHAFEADADGAWRSYSEAAGSAIAPTRAEFEAFLGTVC
ncbi:MAG: hypothetical protein WCF04_00890 [Candidatus Nanopelagicales bacterium]